MNEHTSENQVLFDRLADGELTEAERRQLLTSLDQQPDGWRRCALALLEAQTWRQELTSLIHQEAPPKSEQVVAAEPTPLPARPERWFTLAASLLLAFGLGWSYRAVRHGHQLASQSVESAKPPVASLAADSRNAVTLVVRDIDGRRQRLQLPLVEVSSGDQVASIPDQLRAGLQNRGFDLRQKRRYAPLFFEQGKQLVPMVVPVDDTYVVPVNRPVY